MKRNSQQPFAKPTLQTPSRPVKSAHPMLEADLCFHIFEDGQPVELHRQPSRSFLANFMRLIEVHMRDLSYYDIYFVRQSSTGSIIYHEDTFNLPESTADNTGILLGDGDSPVSADQTDLDNYFLGGTGDHELQHAQNIVDPLNIDGNTATITVHRSFANYSGSQLTIRESGISVLAWDQVQKTGRPVLVVRDLLDTPIDMPHESSIMTSYQLKATA